MTKTELIEEVSCAVEMTRRDSEVIVEAIFNSVVRALRAGDKIEIRGFGSFRMHQRQPRVGRNPKTGARVEVPAKRVPSFKPGTVPQAEVRNPPLNGRNFLDIALLIPGVSPTNTASNQLFAETSAVPGQGLSVSSQRNFSNSFIVDGLSANDDAAGLSGIFYGLDVVNEFQVVTSGGQAEFGRALGGYMNVVTKSGTNTVHGDVYGYFRNQRFNATNSLFHNALPLTQAQYGASFGGPIVRDRTFYFVNFEQRELNQSGLITIAGINAAAINARLTATGYMGPRITTGLYPNPVHNTNFLAKVDHKFNQKDLFSVRYSLYDVHSTNSRGAGALSAASASAGLDDTDQTIAVSNVATLSPRMVNETRGQFTNSNLQAPPSDPIGPAVSISGVASFGTLSGSPTARLNKLYEIADNLSYQAGAHAIRAGADFLYNDTTITYPRSIRGSYSFSSLASFLSGTYNNSGFTQTFDNSVVAQTNPNVGFFAQDEWKVNPHLTFNIGLRYDLQFLQTISTDKNNVSGCTTLPHITNFSGQFPLSIAGQEISNVIPLFMGTRTAWRQPKRTPSVLMLTVQPV